MAPSSAARRVAAAGGEEDAVAGRGADVRDQPGALGVGQVLRDRAAELAVVADQHVGQAAVPALLGELLPAVERAARLRRAARHDDRADVGRLEHAERGVLEVLGAVDEFEAEAQVGLVGAEAVHRVGVGHPRDRRLDLVADQLPQRDRAPSSASAITSSWSTKLISMSSWVNSGCRSARKSSSR